MTEYTRRKVISFRAFSTIFTDRIFSMRYRMFRKIYVLDDVNGNHRIEEHPNIFGYFVFVIFSVFAVLPIMLVNGYIGLIDLKNEWVKLLKHEPLRYENLPVGNVKTIKLLKMAGWVKDS